MHLKYIQDDDFCLCGSNIFFAECCKPSLLNQSQLQYEQLNFPSPPLLKIEHGDYVDRVLRDRLVRRDKGESLPAFTMHCLYWKLGAEWFKKQDLLLEKNRHVVARWASHFWDWNNAAYFNSQKSGAAKKTYPPAIIKELLVLASDLYTLILDNNVPKSLLARLRDNDQFQGARYELGIAAAMTRAGFTITWLKNKSGEKICEFDATHKVSKETVSVEAKSKHRNGTLNQKGNIENLKDAKKDIIGLYKKAVTKRPKEKPFIVFIDINLPHNLNHSGHFDDWTKFLLLELQNDSLFKDVSSPECSILAITNAAWHYDGLGRTGRSNYMAIIPQQAEHLIQHPLTFDAFQFAMKKFGIILED